VPESHRVHFIIILCSYCSFLPLIYRFESYKISLRRGTRRTKPRRGSPPSPFPRPRSDLIVDDDANGGGGHTLNLLSPLVICHFPHKGIYGL
jgi:hypothetical protein